MNLFSMIKLKSCVSALCVISNFLLASEMFAVEKGLTTVDNHVQSPNVGDSISLEGFKLVFSDEFDCNKLDLSKWAYRTDIKHRSVQKRENVSFENGNLKLNLCILKEPIRGRKSSGGGIVSRKRFKYGYYEVRAKLGTGNVDSRIDQGWHHSFWAMAAVIKGDSVGTTYPKMRRTEIDCFENSNNLNEFTQHVIIWKADGKEFGRRPIPPSDMTRIEGYEASDWHTYGFEWNTDRIIFYVDGIVTKIAEYPSGEFEHDEINVWLSGMSAEWCSKNVKHSQALYDYFRFYEKR